jgi:hypothetical protein
MQAPFTGAFFLSPHRPSAMLSGMSRLAWLLLFLLTLPVVAGIYKSIGPEGQVIFSDQAVQGAEEVDVDPLQTYTPPPLPKEPLPDKAKPTQPAPESEGYQDFSIMQPGDFETIWNNEGSVSVALSLQPTLKPGDEFKLVLDDHQVIAQGRSTVVQLQNIDRGTHRLHAVIVDTSGKELARTTTTTFHLRRTIAKRPVPKASVP